MTTEQPTDLVTLPTVKSVRTRWLKDHLARLGEAARVTTEAPTVILNASEADACAAELRDVSGLLRALDADRKSMTAPIDQQKKIVLDFYRDAARPVEARRDDLKAVISVWQRQVAAAQRAEQERAERAAREAQRQAAERAREEREQAAREAAELERLADEKNSQESRQLLQRQADERRARGEVGAMMAEAEAEIATPAPRPVPKLGSGVKTVKRQDVRIVDKRAVLQAVLDGHVPLDVVDIKPVWFRAQLRALGDQFDVPGVEVVEVESVRA